MKIKTSDLIDAALDFAVALARDESVRVEGGRVRFALSQFTNDYDLYSPSTDWAQGGPIIEQELVTVMHRSRPGPYPEGQVWNAVILSNNKCGWYGSTPLIAAMRCIIAGKLGDEVDIPEELT